MPEDRVTGGPFCRGAWCIGDRVRVSPFGARPGAEGIVTDIGGDGLTGPRPYGVSWNDGEYTAEDGSVLELVERPPAGSLR